MTLYHNLRFSAHFLTVIERLIKRLSMNMPGPGSCTSNIIHNSVEDSYYSDCAECATPGLIQTSSRCVSCDIALDGPARQLVQRDILASHWPKAII